MSSKSFTRRTWLTGVAVMAADMQTISQAKAAADPLDWTLTEAAAALAMGRVSSEELTKLCMMRISKLDRPLNAFITVEQESALRQAQECDRQRRAGRVTSHL